MLNMKQMWATMSRPDQTSAEDATLTNSQAQTLPADTNAAPADNAPPQAVQSTDSAPGGSCQAAPADGGGSTSADGGQSTDPNQGGSCQMTEETVDRTASPDNAPAGTIAAPAAGADLPNRVLQEGILRERLRFLTDPNLAQYHKTRQQRLDEYIDRPKALFGMAYAGPQCVDPAQGGICPGPPYNPGSTNAEGDPITDSSQGGSGQAAPPDSGGSSSADPGQSSDPNQGGSCQAAPPDSGGSTPADGGQSADSGQGGPARLPQLTPAAPRPRPQLRLRMATKAGQARRHRMVAVMPRRRPRLNQAMATRADNERGRGVGSLFGYAESEKAPAPI